MASENAEAQATAERAARAGVPPSDKAEVDACFDSRYVLAPEGKAIDNEHIHNELTKACGAKYTVSNNRRTNDYIRKRFALAIQLGRVKEVYPAGKLHWRGFRMLPRPQLPDADAMTNSGVEQTAREADKRGDGRERAGSWLFPLAGLHGRGLSVVCGAPDAARARASLLAAAACRRASRPGTHAHARARRPRASSQCIFTTVQLLVLVLVRARSSLRRTRP